MRGVVSEILRRNVHRAAIAYLAGAWLAVEVAGTVLPLFGIGDTAVRFLVIFLAIAFFPAMALSWAFEWSADGIRSQAEADRDSHKPAVDRRAADRVIITVLSLAVLLFAADKFLVSGSGDTPFDPVIEARSVAVLPFVDMTSGQDHAFFADGLAEELLSLLGRNPALKVAARTSSFSFRDSDIGAVAIGEQLNVGHILEGSVRRSGDQVRITAQLIATSTGFHVWSGTYDESLSDIFDIQDRISAQIADALEARMLSGDIPRAQPTDPMAFERYLRARYLARQGTEASLSEARRLLREVVEIDPNYANAWTNLSAVIANLAANGRIDYDEGYRLAREAALQATAVAPDHSGGYYQLAWISQWYDGDLQAAIENMRAALRIDPRDPALLGNAAVLLLHTGDLEASIAVQEYSARRSPVEPAAFSNLGLAYLYANRLEDAERSFRRTLELSPDYLNANGHLGLTLLLMGRATEALAIYESDSDEASRAKGRAIANHALGRSAESDSALAELIAGWGDMWPSEVVHVHAWRGETDLAFEWLEKEYEKFGAAGWGEWKLQRLYDNLRDDPRWEAFLERVGASDAQLAQYSFEVDVPD